MTKYNTILDDEKTAYLLKLGATGELERLLKYGIISTRVYDLYDARLKVMGFMAKGASKADAVRRVAGLKHVTTKSVYRWIA